MPIIKWFCGGGGDDPVDNKPVDLPPFEWPTRPDAADPLSRDNEAYEREREKCDADRERDEQKCAMNYTLLGGPLFKRQLEEGGKLTPSERKQYNAANKEYSSCMTMTSDFWGQCISNAREMYLN